jgi:hypothetical protein
VPLGNLAQWDGFARAGAREQDVDLALFPLDCIEQAVEVVEIGRVATHAGHVPADQLDGFIERLLLPARDESGELSKDNNVDDYTRYLSSILAGLSIQAANGATKAELKRTVQMALRYLGY